MADEKSAKLVDPQVSSYLKLPIRTLEEAERAKDASDSQWKSVPPPDLPMRDLPRARVK
jgi:hypothetical protein